MEWRTGITKTRRGPLIWPPREGTDSPLLNLQERLVAVFCYWTCQVPLWRAELKKGNHSTCKASLHEMERRPTASLTHGSQMQSETLPFVSGARKPTGAWDPQRTPLYAHCSCEACRVRQSALDFHSVCAGNQSCSNIQKNNSIQLKEKGQLTGSHDWGASEKNGNKLGSVGFSWGLLYATLSIPLLMSICYTATTRNKRCKPATHIVNYSVYFTTFIQGSLTCYFFFKRKKSKTEAPDNPKVNMHSF